jgi:hypothetical protein
MGMAVYTDVACTRMNDCIHTKEFTYMYVCLYVWDSETASYVHVCVCIYIYIYIYIYISNDEPTLAELTILAA